MYKDQIGNWENKRMCCQRYLKIQILLLVLTLVFVNVSWATGEETGESNDYGIMEFLKGKPTEDQFFIGMFTFHFTPSSLESRNWNQKLIGLQYNDFFIGTFENSFYNRSWTAGIARNFSHNQLSNHWDLVTGYRLGGATGYEAGEAPFSSSSPIIPVAELYCQAIGFEHLGIELMLTTSLSVSFFYQF